jgi:hypothetical protein
MHNGYYDITSKMSEDPQWWDENGVPRYDKFHPKHCPDIYADVVVLYLIECQSCRRKLKVSLSHRFLNLLGISRQTASTSCSEHDMAELKLDNWSFGDPPIHGCSGGGETMTSDTIAVLEVWHRNFPRHDWIREYEFEGVVDG